MSSSRRSIFYKMRGTILRHYKLTFFLLIWLMFGIYWSLLRIHQYEGFQFLNVSVPDYLIKEQSEYYFGIILLPAILFWGMKCKQETVNFQFLLRYRGRAYAFKTQALESLIYAAAFSVLITILEIIAAYFLCGKVGNWESENSYYYMNTSCTTALSPYFIFLWVMLMYCIKFMILFVAIDILEWCRNWILLFWLVVFIPCAIERELPIFHKLFAVNYTHWANQSMYILLALGCVIILLEYHLGMMVINKRDFYR